MQVAVHVDLNWAKGPERKSTSGGLMMINGTVVQHWSRTQATRALNTTEAEYYAVITGATEALAMQSIDDGRGTGSCLDGLQCGQGDCVKKRPWEDKTYRVENTCFRT